MDNIHEIPLQNQQDCWAMLYMHLCASMVEYCGQRAKGAIREAVRRLSEDRGRTLRESHLAAGAKTNLKTLYGGFDCLPDPRVRQTILAETDQVRLWEVYTCPVADLWVKAGHRDLGLCYCEEYQHALLKAYTGGKAQVNLSALLTCDRDNHCRFSVYYRRANLSDAQLKESFSEPGQSGSEVVPTSPSFRDGLNALSIKTYYYLLEVAEERFGKDGVVAVTAGLRELAAALAPVLKTHADDTLNTCDRDFLRENFPLALETDSESLWAQYSGHNAPLLLQVNLLDRLKKALGLS
ncbi:MAG TPA: L-2-amino-thiazoline-4-carboxylic acid hydrolase [Firmicutes bacterium]|nr:L-2-amino-thiazoline-4-carboxylic acid hydrolase [Candidatus Fermentithermobacillaceae bacterium]